MDVQLLVTLEPENHFTCADKMCHVTQRCARAAIEALASTAASQVWFDLIRSSGKSQWTGARRGVSRAQQTGWGSGERSERTLDAPKRSRKMRNGATTDGCVFCLMPATLQEYRHTTLMGFWTWQDDLHLK